MDEFLKSNDFMRLGQAINQSNWQPAMMISKRMTGKASELGLEDIVKKLGQMKVCILSKNKTQALNAMTQLTALRVRYLKK